MNLEDFSKLLTKAFVQWRAHKASQFASSFAFFSVLPLPSLLIIFTAVFTSLFGSEAIGQVLGEVKNISGIRIADLFTHLIGVAQSPSTTIFASTISIVMTFIGVLGAFRVLQDSFNTIWSVKLRKRRLSEEARNLVFPFILVLGAGFILLVWTFTTTILVAFIDILFPHLKEFSMLIQVVDLASSFILITLLFASVYKTVPRVEVRWKDVQIGSLLAATGFTISKYFFEFYIDSFVFASTYGIAGSIGAALLWIYLTAQILFIGAEITQVYSTQYGSHAVLS